LSYTEFPLFLDIKKGKIGYPAKLSSEYDGLFSDFTTNLLCTFMKCVYNSPDSSVQKEHSIHWLSMVQLMTLYINDIGLIGGWAVIIIVQTKKSIFNKLTVYIKINDLIYFHTTCHYMR